MWRLKVTGCAAIGAMVNRTGENEVDFEQMIADLEAERADIDAKIEHAKAQQLAAQS